ncbi:MAG: TetR/AcrR family transcriptional regulator [Acidimicrobiales bacterium]|nr:TetR/AcrR family transcriptional regulator [Acidimicrobiales bacterium]
MPAGPKQIGQGVATRAALVDAGRRLFVTQGYFATGTEELVAAADVTRGALYHHFADKQDLFRAVFHAIGADVLAGRLGPLREPVDPTLVAWDQLRQGLRRFLQTVAVETEVQRVILIEGPAVLGWHEWSELEKRYSLGRIERTIEDSIREGLIEPQPASALGQLLLGLVNSGALVVANAADRAQAEAEVVEAVDALLRGLRRPGRAR